MSTMLRAMYNTSLNKVEHRHLFTSWPRKQAEYGDVSTLPAKINHHCLLLATRKTTISRAPAPGAAAGVCSFAATPVSRGTPIFGSTHLKIPMRGASSRLGSSSRGSSSSFTLGPPSGYGGLSQPAPRDSAAGETAAASSVWIGAGHKLGGGAGGGAWGSLGYDGGGGHRRISAGVSNGEVCSCVLRLTIEYFIFLHRSAVQYCCSCGPPPRW